MKEKPTLAATDWLTGGGEMGKVIRSKDWSNTPLGPIESWPQSLRTTVSLCLASNFPISLVWGPQHTQIYNDGYWPICGAKHPKSMGQDFTEGWASAWPAIGDLFERALKGETGFLENQRIFIDRNGYLEETFFTFSFSPIRDETGNIGGLFHPVTETTRRMLAERRTRALRDLAIRLGKPETTEQAFLIATETLAKHELDLPFILLYALNADGKTARLIGSCGNNSGTPLSLEPVTFDAALWPLGTTNQARSPVKIDDLEARFGQRHCGPYPEGVESAMLMPISLPGSSQVTGMMVAEISPRLPLDDEYRGFYDQVTSAVTAAVVYARAYQDERERAERLAEIDRAKTTFFSNVSHEFRTPLTLMIGPLEEVLGVADVPPKQREQIDLAHRNSLRLLKLVNALLDFSRLEAGRVEATYVPTDLAIFTADLTSVFRSAVEKAGLELLVNCPPLPEPVYVDRDMWEKVVLNLISNAFKFTERGRIAVRQQVANGAVELTVEDTGTGIAAAELTNVFKRFHRVENARGRSFEGTGIGLALVHELVKLHGGRVRVESTEGRGSTFAVTIPLGFAHLPSERTRAETDVKPSPIKSDAFIQEAMQWVGREESSVAVSSSQIATSADRPRVLLADDNADMREYVGRMLSGRYEVVAVNDGLAALAEVKKQIPDLLLSDVMMPGLDGFGLLKQLREDPRTRAIPFVMLSARAGEESRVEGMEAGADDYLVKPFSGKELLARVRANLELARVRKEVAAREQEAVGARRLLDVERKSRMEAELAATALRDSQEQLQEARMRLDAALDGGRVATWLWEVGADRLYGDRNMLEMFNLQADRDGGLPVAAYADSLHPDDRPRVMKLLELAMKTGQDFVAEYRIAGVHPPRWCYARARVEMDAEGKAQRMAGAVLDISDRKRAEEALRESAARLSFTLEAARIGDWDLDLSTDTSRRSALHDRAFGFSEPIPEWGFETFIRHIHPDDRDRVGRAFREAVLI